MLTFLDDFERVEADDVYIGESPFRAKVPKAVLSRPSEADAFQKRVQGRHETINARLNFLQFWKIDSDMISLNMGMFFVQLLFFVN